MFAKKEKYCFYNTLAGLVGGLEKEYTTIDLRNECCVTGKIVQVDGYMNIELEDAVFYDGRGKEHCFDSFYVSARNIRHVHIPNDLTTEKMFKRQEEKLKRPRRDVKKRTFKESRSRRYHQETVRDINRLRGRYPSERSSEHSSDRGHSSRDRDRAGPSGRHRR